MTVELDISPDRCTGCRACEIACAFHHNRSFSRRSSSVQINRYERSGKFEIIIHESDEDGYLACDSCEGEEEPVCVKFCLPEAITLGE